jgi:hypothetical protein
MTHQLILTFPAGDVALRREIEQGVEAYADIRQSQSYIDLETVKLVLEVVGQGVAIAGGVAGILTFIRSLQEQKAQQGQSVHITIAVAGQEAIPAQDADAELLTRLLMSDQSH